MTHGFIEFEFDLPDALLQRLIAIFDNMQSARLVLSNLSVIPDAQGVYQLLQGDKVVYIGKTDGDAGLKQRLTRHASTIRHRKGLFVEDIGFRAVRIYVFTAMDLETELIRYYVLQGHSSWNKSGFGSNDPGRNRDDTNLKAGHFDLIYPIDIDVPLELSFPSGSSIASALAALRSYVPYTFRFEGAGYGRSAHNDLHTALMPVVAMPLTTRKIITSALAILPSGWQATLLAGRVILYKENKEYRFGKVIGRSEGEE